jgi:hypothetical protein
MTSCGSCTSQNLSPWYRDLLLSQAVLGIRDILADLYLWQMDPNPAPDPDPNLSSVTFKK